MAGYSPGLFSKTEKWPPPHNIASTYICLCYVVGTPLPALVSSFLGGNMGPHNIYMFWGGLVSEKKHGPPATVLWGGLAE